jgi:predicted negative regulator of RcsB-dependent stress response
VEFETVGDGLMRLGKKAEAARLYRQAIALDKEKADLAIKLNKAVKS